VLTFQRKHSILGTRKERSLAVHAVKYALRNTEDTRRYNVKLISTTVSAKEEIGEGREHVHQEAEDE
jgi:hypothetical protein